MAKFHNNVPFMIKLTQQNFSINFRQECKFGLLPIESVTLLDVPCIVIIRTALDSTLIRHLIQ